MEYISIPLDRIGVLIGTKGQVKSDLERLTGTIITVDSNEGLVTIKFVEHDDPLKVWKARDIVRAIGRGFSPKNAFKLLNDEVYLEIMALNSYLGHSKRTKKRIKGRIIGFGGKARRIIEDLTKTKVSIYGDTVAIIGNLEDLLKAKEAIEMLIKGSQHSTVYRMLSSYRSSKKPIP